jgi:hypothetical protein
VRSRISTLVFLCLLTAKVYGTPIYSNMGSETILESPPGTLDFWSLEPFVVGAFWDLNFNGYSILSNPFNPFVEWFDGEFHRAKWTVPSTECRAIQVDASSGSFPGIGYLIDYTTRNCGGGVVIIQPTGLLLPTPPLFNAAPSDPIVPMGPIVLIDPVPVPVDLIPVPEPATLTLVGIGLLGLRSVLRKRD